MHISERVRRWCRPLAVGAVLAATVLVGQPADAAQPSPVTGLEIVRAISSIDSLSSKSATAYCPAGKRVIGGGGGLVWDLQHHTRQVLITRMQPVHPILGQDSFIVTGEETTAGTTENWWLDAYAICADPLPGLRIKLTFSGLSSESVQQAQAECRSDEQVIGSGAYIYNSGGQVGLHVVRAGARGCRWLHRFLVRGRVRGLRGADRGPRDRARALAEHALGSGEGGLGPVPGQ